MIGDGNLLYVYEYVSIISTLEKSPKEGGRKLLPATSYLILLNVLLEKSPNEKGRKRCAKGNQ